METVLFHGSSFWNLDSFSGFRALNWRGTIRWKFAGVTGGFSTPASAEDGNIYVGSDDGHLYALSPNGQLKWSFATGSFVVASPALGWDGSIYIASYDIKLYALDRRH